MISKTFILIQLYFSTYQLMAITAAALLISLLLITDDGQQEINKVYKVYKWPK